MYTMIVVLLVGCAALVAGEGLSTSYGVPSSSAATTFSSAPAAFSPPPAVTYSAPAPAPVAYSSAPAVVSSAPLVRLVPGVRPIAVVPFPGFGSTRSIAGTVVDHVVEKVASHVNHVATGVARAVEAASNIARTIATKHQGILSEEYGTPEFAAAPAPIVSYAAPAPVQYAAPAPVQYYAPAPVVHYSAPAPAPAVQYSAPAPAPVQYSAPAEVRSPVVFSPSALAQSAPPAGLAPPVSEFGAPATEYGVPRF